MSRDSRTGSPAPQATILRPDGRSEPLALAQDLALRIRQVQNLVGGPLEVVPVEGKQYLVLSASAKDGRHAVNRRATSMAMRAESIPLGDYVAGTVVLIPHEALP